MGLRFRKSVTLCKGVRLNFGKTGTSVSVGGHGYRKTFHSSGRVTTSVGIPGTGIYWTDTKGSRKSRSPQSSSTRNKSTVGTSSSSVTSREIRDYSLDRTIPAENVNYDPVWLTESSNDALTDPNFEATGDFASFSDGYDDTEQAEEITESTSIEEPVYEKRYLTEAYIRNIYVQCDESIDWGEILAGTSADEMMMERSFWLECKKYSAKIMRGDIDAYLEVIEAFRPVDDILLYAGEFEFGTDSSKYIETEFRIEPDEMFEEGIHSPLFEDFVYAVSIRVARDLMALLPVKNVVIHVVCDDITIFSSIMNRGNFTNCDFKREPLRSIVGRMNLTSGIGSNQIHEVERKSVS